MKYCITLLALFYCYSLVNAQNTKRDPKTIKAQFLVIGSTAAGIAAGMQAAKSGVKTLIIDSTAVLGTDLHNVDTVSQFGLNNRFAKELREGKSSTEILQRWISQSKGLTLLQGVRVISANKTASGWQMTLSNGQTVLTNLVFEDEGHRKVEYSPGKFMTNLAISTTVENWRGSLYRTQVAYCWMGRITSYPLSRFVRTTKENWIVIPAVERGNFTIGQIVGAMAANIDPATPRAYDVRGVQKILFKEGIPLCNYNDMKIDDPHFNELQRILATGVLFAYGFSPGGTMAIPDGNVEIERVMPAFISYYSKAKAWFAKHSRGKMTIAEALELIYYAENKSFDVQIELEWNRKLKFTSAFNPERKITRREFAVLLDTYLNPFEVKVDMMGMLRK